MKKVGFGILGTGMIADFHRQAISQVDNAELIAVSHHDPKRFADFSGQFGVPCVGETDMLANPGVDAVVICTPSGMHAEQAVRAMQAGKHVLVEKPMALSLEDADRMIDVAQQSGVHLAVCLQRRTEPLFIRVRDAVMAGHLGDVTLASLVLPYFRPDAYYEQAAWRGTWAGDGGGVLMNQGIHLIDLLVWILGDPIGIQAQAGTLKRSVEVEDTVVATLGFPGGALGTVSATTTAQPGFPHQFNLHGSKGSIIVTGDAITTWSLAGADTVAGEVEQPQASLGAGTAADPRGIDTAGHVSMITGLVSAIQSGTPLLIDGVQGRRSLAAVLEIYRAAQIIP